MSVLLRKAVANSWVAVLYHLLCLYPGCKPWLPSLLWHSHHPTTTRRRGVCLVKVWESGLSIKPLLTGLVEVRSHFFLLFLQRLPGIDRYCPKEIFCVTTLPFSWSSGWQKQAFLRFFFFSKEICFSCTTSSGKRSFQTIGSSSSPKIPSGLPSSVSFSESSVYFICTNQGFGLVFYI